MNVVIDSNNELFHIEQESTLTLALNKVINNLQNNSIQGKPSKFTTTIKILHDFSPKQIFAKYYCLKRELEYLFMFTKFCTLILTVFGENQRTTPVLFFKGKGHASADDRQQYSKGIHVIFSPKAVINVPSMNTFITNWWKM
ncbi:unnamed protein product, partial [Adineta steineri]